MSKELKTLLSTQESERSNLIQDLIDSGVIQKRVRATKDETESAYKYVLDSGDNANKALQAISDKYTKKETWVDEIKHSPIYKNVIDYSIRQNKDHPTFSLMRDTKIWNSGTKRNIRSASTLSSFLNSVSDQVNLANRVANLENITGLLVDHAVATDKRLDKLENKSDIKEKALQLLADGHTISEVSEITGKHRNTVSAWIDKIGE